MEPYASSFYSRKVFKSLTFCSVLSLFQSIAEALVLSLFQSIAEANEADHVFNIQKVKIKKMQNSFLEK